MDAKVDYKRTTTNHSALAASLVHSQGLQMTEMQREESIEQERHRVHGILMEPYLFITEKSGKGVRNKLIDAFQLWLKVPEVCIEHRCISV
jgi:hypothetical protein